MKAKVARFYGWTDYYISSLGVGVFMEYWNAITPIEAQETILKFKVVDFPHLKSSQRKEIHKDISSKISGMIKKESTGPAKSTQDFAKMLAESLSGKR